MTVEPSVVVTFVQLCGIRSTAGRPFTDGARPGMTLLPKLLPRQQTVTDTRRRLWNQGRGHGH
jgi:hypothetical protein